MSRSRSAALLEQRIARAHRMGQKRAVQIYLLVTEQTIEEKLLGTLSAKHDLALAALDMESDVREVQLASVMEELKRRLEVLLGAKPQAAVNELKSSAGSRTWNVSRAAIASQRRVVSC